MTPTRSDVVETVSKEDREMTSLARDDFREAMSSFPSGVTIVTTTDAAGRWWGFTATSFCSVSVDPPLVLVCLANTAECYPVFATAQQWVIHFIRSDHSELAMRFATRGADKFATGGFDIGKTGLPVLRDASVTLHCTLYARYPGGDHVILVGRVQQAEIGPEEAPVLYYRRSFREVQLRRPR